MTAAETEARSLRRILLDFINDYLDANGDQFTNEVLIEAAEEQLLDDDEFQTALARDAIRLLLPDVLHSIVSQRRSVFANGADMHAKGNESTERTREDLAGRVFEAVNGKWRSLLDLKKPELLALNERDRKENAVRERWIGFREELAKPLRANESPRQHFNSTQIDAIWRRHFASQAEAE